MWIKDCAVHFFKKKLNILLTLSLVFLSRTAYAYSNIRSHDIEEFLRGGYWKAWLFLLILLVVCVLLGEKKRKTGTNMYWKSTSREEVKFQLQRFSNFINKLEMLSLLSFDICSAIVLSFVIFFPSPVNPLTKLEILCVMLGLNIFYLLIWIFENLRVKRFVWVSGTRGVSRRFFPWFWIPVGISASLFCNLFLSGLLSSTILDLIFSNKLVPEVLFIFPFVILSIVLNIIYYLLLKYFSKLFLNVKMKRSSFFVGAPYAFYIVPDFLEKELFEGD